MPRPNTYASGTAVVSIRPDRDRTVVTADTFRQARAHLAAHGLRKDGQYGGPGEACCAVGHVAAITRDLHVAEEAVEEAWLQWTDGPFTPHSIILWNDRDATAADVDWFYESTAERLEGGRP